MAGVISVLRHAVIVAAILALAALGAPAATATAQSPSPVCADGVDNDADGYVDYPDDTGCEDAQGATEETDPLFECSDLEDNDGDGTIDDGDEGCRANATEVLERLPRLGVIEARGFLAFFLRSRFGGTYTAGYAREWSCRRVLRTRVRCRVTWVVGDLAARGVGTAWLTRGGSGRNGYEPDATAWRFSWRVRLTNEYCEATKQRRPCSRTVRIK